MPFITRIEARAYARATEILERVTSSVLALFPEDVKSRVKLSTINAEGLVGDMISIITAVFENKDSCVAVFDYIFSQLDKMSRRALQISLELRVDEHCVLFLRFDKQAAFLGKIRLIDEPDVISVRFHFMEYPRCERNDAILFIEERLQIAGGLD
ncbi:MAG: hypothetical protein JW779_09505 [Candidatus Thorarchaeota archaeon]|nr:hypothetical protein [Candidatus Thorarchaeota archaeon]